MSEELLRMAADLSDRLARLETHDTPRLVPLVAPLTSASWDGDSFSTTAKTVIDLSAVFGVPANVKAVLAYGAIRDSDSAATYTRLLLSPNATAGEGPVTITATPVNDRMTFYQGVVPCDANGDIYYQITASGANTMDIWVQIWGYWI